MILGEDDIPRYAVSRGHRGKTAGSDPTDREAFVVTLPQRLLAESTAPWPTWLAPPGALSTVPAPVAGGYSQNPDGRPAATPHPDARRSSLEFPAPARA